MRIKKRKKKLNLYSHHNFQKEMERENAEELGFPDFLWGPRPFKVPVTKVSDTGKEGKKRNKDVDVELMIRITLHRMPRLPVLTLQEWVVFQWACQTLWKNSALEVTNWVLFWLHCLLGWVTLAEPLNIPWPAFSSLGIIPVLPASQGCWTIWWDNEPNLPEKNHKALLKQKVIIFLC